MTRHAAIAIVCLSLSSSASHAEHAVPTTVPAPPQYGAWHSSRIGGGGYVQNVAIAASDPKRLYTYVDMAGAYRSDDGGLNWRMIHAALPPVNGGYDVRGVSVDPRNADDVLFAVGNHRDHAFGIFHSRDGGATYELARKAIFSGNGTPHRADGQVIDRHPTNADVVIAGEYADGLHRSDDNGKTWRSLGLAGHMFTDVRFDRTNGDRIFVSAQPYEGKVQGETASFPMAFFRSDDGGKTWRKLSDDSPTEICQSLAEPSRWFGIFRGNGEVRESTDNGETWTRRSNGLKIEVDVGGYTSPHRYNALAAGPDFMLAGNAAGDVFRMNAKQSAWTLVAPKSVNNPPGWSQSAEVDGSFGHAMGFLLVDPRDAKHWIMTDWFAIWHTFDSGAKWSLGIGGYEPTYVFHLATDPQRPRLVHAAVSDNGYLRSEDGGRSFRRDVKGISSQIRDVDVALSRPDRVYAVGGSAASHGQWWCDQLYVSDDAGRSWAAAKMNGLPPLDGKRFAASVSADPENADVVWLGVSGDVRPGSGGAYRSTDGGASFTWCGAGLENGEGLFRATYWGTGREIQTMSHGGLLCIGEGSNNVFRFDPATQRWSTVLELGERPRSIAIDPAVAGRILISASGAGLWRSDNDGATWTQCYKGSTQQAAWDGNHPGRAMVATSENNAGLLMTTDGGSTWTAMDPRLPMRVGLRPAFVGGVPLVGTAGSGVFWFDESAGGR